MTYTVDDKAAFAAFLFANPLDRFGAAKFAMGADASTTDMAAMAATLPKDEYVLSEVERLRQESANEETLPNKADLARLVWTMAEDTAASMDDRLKAAKLYAEVRSFIDKPSPAVHDANVIPSVMIVREHGSDKEWEQKMKEQQERLTSGKHVAKQTPKDKA